MKQESENILLLDRFMRGETSEDEDKQLLAWFRSNESRAEILEHYKEMWEEAKKAGRPIDSELQERMLRQIRERLNASEKKAARHTLSIGIWMKYAAAVIIVLGIGIGIGTRLNPQHSNNLLSNYSVTAEKGQRASVVLPDGTKVWLNSHSTLSYQVDYGEKERDVTLNGEAYFEVAKDKKHRFVVNAENIQVEALGTKFNVEAYDDSNDFCTSLMQGSVEVFDNNNPSSHVILKPDYQVSIIDGQLKTEAIQDYDLFRWREGLICFKDVTFEQLMIRFEKCYGIRVSIQNNKAKSYVCSGKFRISDGIDNALRILQKDARYKFERDEDNTTIYIK